MLSPPLSANLWVSNACYPTCSHTFHYLARKIRCVYTYGNVFCIYKVFFHFSRIYMEISFSFHAPHWHMCIHVCVSLWWTTPWIPYVPIHAWGMLPLLSCFSCLFLFMRLYLWPPRELFSLFASISYPFCPLWYPRKGQHNFVTKLATHRWFGLLESQPHVCLSVYAN